MKNKYIIYRLGDEGKYNQVDWVIHTEKEINNELYSLKRHI